MISALPSVQDGIPQHIEVIDVFESLGSQFCLNSMSAGFDEIESEVARSTPGYWDMPAATRELMMDYLLVALAEMNTQPPILAKPS